MKKTTINFGLAVEVLMVISIILFTATITVANFLTLLNYNYSQEDIVIAKSLSYNTPIEAVSGINVLEVEKEVVEEPVMEEIIPYEEYTIKSGDTLWEISSDYYGSGTYYTWIEKCNNLYGSNRNLIRNQVLRLYPLDYKITTKEIEANGIAKEQSLRSPYLDIPEYVDYNDLIYYDTIHITGYDPYCDHCCGKHDGITASGNSATYYKTVACNSLPFGTEIYIEGYGYFIVEDRGGATLGIDIACENHEISARMSDPGRKIYIVNN